MNKKFIALFAACTMTATACVGLVQTAYADEDPVSIVVSDGATDTEKVLTFYYNLDSVNSIEGYLSLDNGATIDSAAITIEVPAGMGEKNASTTSGQLLCLSYDAPLTSADKSFATATVTVPGDKDVTVSFRIEAMLDADDNDFGGGTVTTTIPKKSAPIPQKVDAAVTAVEKQNTEAINGTGQYESQTADIWGVEITPNDDSVTGATVSIGGQSKDLNFKTVCSGEGTVVFAVILASETGAALPALTEANVTPITAEVE